jgi:putative ABC transport system permease protein
MARTGRFTRQLFTFAEAVVMGISSLRAYKMRAGLTILGVVMGIMTVIGMSSVIAGLNASMAAQIQNLGSSVIFIRPQGPGENVSAEERRRRRALTEREVSTIERDSPAVAAVAPIEPLFGSVIKYGDESVQGTQLAGVTPAYEEVHDLSVDRGRFLVDADVSRGSRVAVLGLSIAESLFPNVEAIGKSLTIDGRRFEVVGVLEKQGKFLFFDRDNLIFVPMGSVQRGRDPRFKFIVADVKPVSAERLDEAVGQITEALRRERKLRFWHKDNFAVFTQQTFTEFYDKVTGGIYMVMIAISSIGLVVGGVGVMNIMLVSVTERTREIGVRKALGATRRDILWQFLTEAMVLTGAGGVIGVAIGGLVAMVVDRVSPFPAVLQTTWVMIGLVTSMVVGLVFGLWPAAKAASLDPIEALRYE